MLLSESTEARIVTVHVSCVGVHVNLNVPPVESPTGDPSWAE